MKVIGCMFAFAVFFLPINLAAQHNKEYNNDSVKLVSIAGQLLNAAGSGDTTVYKKYLHTDYIMMAEDGKLKTKKDIMAELSPLPKGYEGTLTVTKPVVKKHDNIYILHFIADEHLKLFGQTLLTSYAETDTYRKKGNTWELLASEVFELPTDPFVQHPTIEKLKSYVGTYQLTAAVQYKITLEEGKIMGQRTSRDKVQWMVETETVFFIPGQRGRKIFVSDETGKVIKMLERRSGVDLVWTKVSE